MATFHSVLLIAYTTLSYTFMVVCTAEFYLARGPSGATSQQVSYPSFINRIYARILEAYGRFVGAGLKITRGHVGIGALCLPILM